MSDKEMETLEEMKKQSEGSNSLAAQQAYINALEYHRKDAQQRIAELQQQSAMQQLEIMRLRDALLMAKLQGSRKDSNEIIDKALSIQTTYDDLMAWHEAQLGEPVAVIHQGDSGYPQLRFVGKYSYDSIARKQPDIKLYAKKG